MESKAKKEHRKSVSSSIESSPTEPRPPPVGAIGSSTRNVVLPSSERRQSTLGVMGSSTRGLTVPAYEPSPLLTVASGSSLRDPGLPSSERHPSITGFKGSSTRGPVAPSFERRPSLTPATGSSTRRLSTPLEQHKPVTLPMEASMKELAIPSPEQPLTGSVGSATRAVDKVSADHRKSIVSATGSYTTGLAVKKAGPRKSITSAKGVLPKEAEEAKVRRRQWALTRPLVMVTVLTSFGSSLQYGYNLWIANHPAVLIENFYNSSDQLKKKVSTDKDFLGVLYNLTIAIFSFGGLVGSLLFSAMVDKFGRKGSLLINNVLSFICSFLMGLSPTIRAFEFSIFSRLVTGICSGIFSILVPVYLAELAPKSVRGGIMMVSVIFIIAGLLVSQILGLPKFLGTKKDWPILMSIPGGLALFQIIILPFFPESPRYLLIQERKEERARKALQKLRCQEDVEEEITELYQEDQAEKPEKGMNGMKLLCYRGLRWQVISIIVLVGGQQLSGVNAAYYFAERVYAKMSLKRYEVRYINVFSTILILVASMVVAYVIDTVGRRVLILVGFGLCSILCVLVTMTLELQNTISWMPYVSSSLIFIFLIGHVIGPGTMPNVIIAEIFLQSSRSTACALSGFIHWLINFITVMVFSQIEAKIGFYSFLLFWPFCFGTFFYIFKIIPETKEKTFVDIRRLMSVHMAVARKIQVQSAVVNGKQNKQSKKKKTTHSGKKKKRRKSVGENVL